MLAGLRLDTFMKRTYIMYVDQGEVKNNYSVLKPAAQPLPTKYVKAIRQFHSRSLTSKILYPRAIQPTTGNFVTELNFNRNFQN